MNTVSGGENWIRGSTPVTLVWPDGAVSAQFCMEAVDSLPERILVESLRNKLIDFVFGALAGHFFVYDSTTVP